MTNALPTFRALAVAAVQIHLSAAPGDGVALMLDDAASALPVVDHRVFELIQAADAAVTGACAALAGLRDPQARGRLDICRAAQGAYHRAAMAYFGKDVAEEVAA